MKALPPQLNWLQRLFGRGRRLRNAPGTAANPVGNSRVSSSVLLSAKRALQWIMVVPGSAKIMANIDMALETISGFEIVSTAADSAGPPYQTIIMAHIPLISLTHAPQTNVHDERMRRRLDYQVQYLVEPLEPFSIMRGDQISPALQSQVSTLGR